MVSHVRIGLQSAMERVTFTEASTVHALAFPMPAQGHINPYMRLCDLLSSRGLNVVLLTTPLNAKKLHSHDNVTVMEIPLPPLPDLPHGVECTDQIPPSLVTTLMGAIEKTEPAFTHIVARLLPKCLIADFVPFFLPAVASNLKIPVLHYCTSGAYSLCITHSIISRLPLPAGEATVALTDLPKPITLHDSDILPPYRGASKSDTIIYSLDIICGRFREACGLVVNTVNEMEAEFVAHMERTFGVRVWTVGPVVSPSLLNDREASWEGCGAVRSWLDSRKLGSVVYVNFGSEIALSAEQAGEVAAGLEASGWCFLLALKKPAGREAEEDFVGGFLPAGFRERSGEKGMVVAGWVPQEAILRHPAIGAFLSHCGWNSTLESIRQGVPLLAWPFAHDQPFVKKLLVEEMGVAEELMKETAKSGNGCVVRSGEIERGVKAVMVGEKGEELRRRAAQWKDSVIRAVREGGSSFNNLENLAIFIKSLQFH